MSSKKTVRIIRPRGCFGPGAQGEKSYKSQWPQSKKNFEGEIHYKNKERKEKKMIYKNSSVKELASAIESLLAKIDKVAKAEIDRLTKVEESINKSKGMLLKVRMVTKGGLDNEKEGKGNGSKG